MQHEPEEGVIKFRCEHLLSNALNDDLLIELKHFRQLLYMQKLIGVDENGIGYGNISQRFQNTNKFIITGTQTGHLPVLDSTHFTLVDDYNIAENSLKCIGPVKASSESLTHAAIYLANPVISAVIHIHNAETWEKYLHKLPTTPANILYGSAAMAFSIMGLARNIQNGVVIMAGHKDGIIVYGKDLGSAYNSIIDLL